jgi:hypothetical protein
MGLFMGILDPVSNGGQKVPLTHRANFRFF